MDITSQCVEILTKALAPENEVRQQAENLLSQFINSNPDEAIRSEIRIVQAQQLEERIRSLAILIIRRQVSFAPSAIWGKLQPQTQMFVKSQLLVTLEMMNDQRMMKLVADAVIALGAVTLSAGLDQWNPMLEMMSKWATSQNVQYRCIAYQVFSQLLTNLEAKFEPFYNNLEAIFQEGIKDRSHQVRFQALSGIVHLILLSKPHRKTFQPLIPYMVETITISLQNKDEEVARDALSYLAEFLADMYPSFFDNHIEAICQTMYMIASSAEWETETRHLALEFIATIAESKPTLITEKQPSLVNKLVPFLLGMMMSIEDNSEWNAGEEFDIENEDYEVGAEVIDRLSLSLGGAVLIPVLFESLVNMLQQSEWRSRYAALMAISLVGEGCNEFLIPILDKVINLILPLYRDPHERVRFAYCNTIGQLSTDFSPMLQQRYQNQVVSSLVALMDDTANPRVQSHASAAMINFCDNCPPEILMPYIDFILGKMYGLLMQQKLIVLEQTVTAIASVADCVKGAFEPYYDQFIPYLKSILKEPITKDVRMLRGKTMEALSLIAGAVGKEKFIGDAKEVLDSLLSNLPTEPDDPQEKYLPNTLLRFCKCLKQDFVPYLGFIIPNLIAKAAHKPDLKVLDNMDEAVDPDIWEKIRIRDQTIAVNTVVLQEKGSAVNMIYGYAEHMGEGFSPYVDEVAPICCKLTRFYLSDDVRISASSCLPLLLKSFVKAVALQRMDPQCIPNLFNFIWPHLMESINVEMITEVSIAKLDALQELIDLAGPGCLSPQMMRELCENLKSAIQSSVDHRKIINTALQKEVLELEERRSYVEQYKRLEELIVAVEEVLGQGLKHHCEQFLPIFLELLPYFASLMGEGATFRDRQAAFYAFDDLIEYGGPQAVPYYQGQIHNYLKHMHDPDPPVRQAVIYGLGLLAQFSGDLFAQIMPATLNQLDAYIKTPGSREKDKVVLTENAISAVGKIIIYQERLIDVNQVVPQWLSYFPVNKDEQECPVIYGQFCTIFHTHAKLMLGENFSNLPHILRIFADVTGTELVTEEVDSAISSIILTMTREFPRELMESAAMQLSEMQRIKLQKCVSS